MKQTLLYIAVSLATVACQRSSLHPTATRWEQLPIVAERGGDGEEALIVCHPEKMTDSIALPLSYFVEDLEIVRLENRDEAYVRGSSVRISDNYILVHSSRNVPFKLFDRKGRFLCTIGNSGNGRGNYGQVGDFQLDEKHGHIYLMPWNATELIVYNLQGHLLPPIPLNSPDERAWALPKATFHVDGERREVTVAVLPWTINPRMAWVQDYEGHVLRQLPYNPYQLTRDYSSELYHLHNMEAFEFSVLNFNPEREDTLFHYYPEENRLVPVFTLDFPDDRLQRHYHNELPRCFIGTLIGGMRETGFAQSESRDHINFIVDKCTLRGGRYRVYNDFLGNTDVYWLKQSRNGYYTRNLSPQMLKTELEEALRRSDLTPAMRQKVSALSESIDIERDNNYLMIGKLRRNLEAVRSTPLGEINLPFVATDAKPRAER